MLDCGLKTIINLESDKNYLVYRINFCSHQLKKFKKNLILLAKNPKSLSLSL